MKTTKRFDEAVTKLYNAFHENRLIGMDCKACAVGNICNNSDEWNNITYKFLLNYNLEDNLNILGFGYSAYELITIEMIFLFGYKEYKGRKKYSNHDNTIIDKEQQFKGLCAVVEYLCELDNIPNVMDYTKLFETENDKPKYQLC